MTIRGKVQDGVSVPDQSIPVLDTHVLLRGLFLVPCLLVLLVANRSLAIEPPITDLAFAPDGKSVVATSQAGLHVFRWDKLARDRTQLSKSANLHCVQFSPNGKFVAVGGGNPAESGIVEVFSWPDGKPVSRLKGHADSVRAIAWRDDSRLLSASIDREIKLWDVVQKKAVRTYKGHSRSVDSVILLNDGETLVSAGVDQTVRVWSVDSGKLIRSLNQHTKPIHSLALKPTKSGLPMIASAAGDRTIRLWQPTIGRMVRYVRLDAEPLRIAWLNDGAHIAAACVDGGVRVINADEVRVIRTITAIDGWAYAIAVHPSDSTMAIGGSDGTVRKVRLTQLP